MLTASGKRLGVAKRLGKAFFVIKYYEILSNFRAPGYDVNRHR